MCITACVENMRYWDTEYGEKTEFEEIEEKFIKYPDLSVNGCSLCTKNYAKN